MFKSLRILLTLLVVTCSTITSADLAIIAHPNYQGGDLDVESVKKLFLRQSTKYPSGHKAAIANHSLGSQDRKDFFEYVLNMGEARHKRYWSRKVSTGKKGLPKELDSHKDVLEWVANTPLGITYIDQEMVDDSVQVLLTVYVFKDI
jgi:hypothetical protein